MYYLRIVQLHSYDEKHQETIWNSIKYCFYNEYNEQCRLNSEQIFSTKSLYAASGIMMTNDNSRVVEKNV